MFVKKKNSFPMWIISTTHLWTYLLKFIQFRVWLNVNIIIMIMIIMILLPNYQKVLLYRYSKDLIILLAAFCEDRKSKINRTSHKMHCVSYISLGFTSLTIRQFTYHLYQKRTLPIKNLIGTIKGQNPQ